MASMQCGLAYIARQNPAVLPMIVTLVVLYGLALIVAAATRSPPGYTDYREGEILE